MNKIDRSFWVKSNNNITCFYPCYYYSSLFNCVLHNKYRENMFVRLFYKL